jgi:hypothetical protein
MRFACDSGKNITPKKPTILVQFGPVDIHRLVSAAVINRQF